MKELKKIKKYLNYNLNLEQIPKIILNQAKKEKNIIYGAQSIKKQTGLWGRDSFDYDVFSKTPKKSAFKTERKLDKITRGDNFYTKPAKHKGTWKVKYIGFDLKKDTPDDVGIIDYTKIPPKTPYVKINNVRYRILKEEKLAKLKALKDPKSKFRHPKDKNDLNRIKFFEILKGGKNVRNSN